MSSHGSPAEQTFADQVRAIPGGEHLNTCYACGTCVGRCPVQRRGEPTYNARRLIHKVVMGMEEAAFEDRTTWLCSACDLCYPTCPQEILISGVIGAIRELAVRAGHSSPIRTAVVNGQTCVACGMCVEVCPYEAVKLAKTSVAGRGREVTIASVDPNRCTACGLCAASCRSTSIGLPDENSSEELVAALWSWMGIPVAEVQG